MLDLPSRTMPDDPSVPQPTPANYQRTTGGDHLRWQPPTPEHLQEMLPAYEILSIIGKGGMGAVYKGRQKSLDRIIAIKILPPEAGVDDMQFVERFKNEARTMAKMNHPAIVHVYDFGETSEGQLYIVMEFIDGTDVAKMIQSQGKLPEDYALSITAHVCDALGYAHTHGVVHRDIKPANILINMEGQVKVADFGLAKATDPKQMGLTKTNMAMGTPDFVSPEALTPGVPLDGRADLYAVGVMLYNMLTGTIPRGAFRMPSITLQTDARFDRIISKAMEMDRENRYQTALELRRDLDVILTAPAAKSGGQPQPAQQAAPPPQKPLGKSPSAPQQGKPTGAATTGSTAPDADKPAATPAAVPAKKSDAVMIYGIAAAVVVIAGAAVMFSGGEKQPAPAPTAVAEKKTEPKKPESKPATPPPAAAKPKPPETKPAPTPATVAAGNEKWVDGLAQWFGGTQTHKAFVRESNGAAQIGANSATLKPLPSSAPEFHDQVVRMRWHGINSKAELRVFLRLATEASGKGYSAVVKASQEGSWELRLEGPRGTIGNRARTLPADFKPEETHLMEFRVIGDHLTATVDGQRIVEAPDTQLTTGHPAFSGHDIIIESFEYANLDDGGSTPVLAFAKSTPAPAAPIAAETKSGKPTGFSPPPSPAASAPPAAPPTPTPAPTMPAPAPDSAPAASADPRLAQLAAGFKARHDADALQPFATAVAALNTSYVANGVSRARAAAKAKGSLVEVTALDDEKAAIEKGRGVPDEDDPDTIEALKTLRSTYRTAYAKLAAERDARAAPLYDLYLNALDAYIAELTQADKIADARKLQVFRDDIALQKPGAAAATQDTTSAPASGAPSKPAAPALKLSEHEVAEWVLSTGGSVEVAFDTPMVKRTIAVASELPRSRFVIINMTVNGSRVPGKDLSPLASARSTESLVLFSQLPDKTFLNIMPLRQMTALYRLRCGEQDAASMDVIASLELTSLDIGKLPEGSFEKIARMKHLEYLESPSITGPGIAALKGCKKLRRINNRTTPNPVTDDDVRALVTALPDLEELSLGNAQNGAAPITNACVPSLLALKSLRVLGLNGKDINDNALETVTKLRKLEMLRLEATQVTGSGFKALAKLEALRDLSLHKTPITDAALEDLAKVKTLKSLNLQETSVSETAVAKLQNALPGCKITTK